jgi:cyclic beta-1,2-glucan synthetase
LVQVLRRFADLCAHRGDSDRAAHYRGEADRIAMAVDEHCWDGEYYLRAFYDDGTPMGSHVSDECRIDSLPQSFATISGIGSEERRAQALDRALAKLVDREYGIVKLFTPAFDHSHKNPGYVKAYPPGLRENGGQYTHAAMWLALAVLKAGRADEGYDLIQMLNPAVKAGTQESAKRYKLEPYAVAADVYTNPAAMGRGGWSLYTGAAGWYYKVLVEWMLGIKLQGDRLSIEPVLPSVWNGFEADLVWNNTAVHLVVRRGEQTGLTVDGQGADFVPLDGKRHVAMRTIPCAENQADSGRKG